METGQRIAMLFDRARGRPRHVARLFRALAQLPAALPLGGALVRWLCDALQPGAAHPTGAAPDQKLLFGLSSGPPVVRWNVSRLLLTCPDRPARRGSRLFLTALADPFPAVRQRALEALAEGEWPAGYPLIGGDAIGHLALLSPDEPMREAGLRMAMKYGVRGVHLDLQRLADGDPSPALRRLADRGLSLLSSERALLAY
jgi:hypothetical protein